VNDITASLRDELAIEKQKRHTMEELLRKSNVTFDSVTSDDSLYKKVGDFISKVFCFALFA